MCTHDSEEKTVVVLQDTVLNSSLPTVVCAMVEFCPENEETFPNEIILSEKEMWTNSKGVCMLHKVVTVNRRSMFDKKGELNEKNLKMLYKALDNNLGRFRDKK